MDSHLFQGYWSESEHNSTIGFRKRTLRGLGPALETLRQTDLFDQMIRHQKFRVASGICVNIRVNQLSSEPQNYVCESKSNAFFLRTGITTNTGTCIIYQNEPALLWITFLLLNIVTVSLNRNVSSSNESMNLCFLKFG